MRVKNDQKFHVVVADVKISSGLMVPTEKKQEIRFWHISEMHTKNRFTVEW